MNFNQIVEDPEMALKNMVVFDGIDFNSPILDETTDNFKDIAIQNNKTYVNNVDRMNAVYNIDSLKNYKSYGYIGDPVVIYPKASLKGGSVILGSVNGSSVDVMEQGADKKISYYLNKSLGGDLFIGPMKAEWTFTDLKPGKTYTLKYDVLNDKGESNIYTIKGTDCEILNGDIAGISIENNVLSVEFKPITTECKIFIDYNEQKENIEIDAVNIAEAY